MIFKRMRNLKKKSNNSLKAYEETAKAYPIILSKPFFNFGWSLAKLKCFLNRKG